MRITLDTNQFVRALMRPPELATFVMAWQAKRFTVVSSPQLLQEYEIVLQYPKIAELIFPELRRVVLTQLASEIELVDLPEIPAICRDPDDDRLIACAVVGGADVIVSGDDDLLALERVGDVPILTATQFLDMLRQGN